MKTTTIIKALVGPLAAPAPTQPMVGPSTPVGGVPDPVKPPLNQAEDSKAPTAPVPTQPAVVVSPVLTPSHQAEAPKEQTHPTSAQPVAITPAPVVVVPPVITPSHQAEAPKEQTPPTPAQPVAVTPAPVVGVPNTVTPVVAQAEDSKAPTVTSPPSDNPPQPVPADPIPATVALKRIRAEMAGIFQRAAGKVASGELPLIGWGLSLPRVQKLAAEHEGRPWFFIGDIHGDFLAWHRLFERVRKEKDFRLCFLGDLVDRGPLDAECFAALLEAAERHPGQILWILGNHDEGVRFNPKAKIRFSSTVEPAEFVDYLNTPQDGLSPQQLEDLGKLFIDICRRLPRAVLFPDGLLATHGGMPLKDRWDTLKTLEAFHHERTLGDFTWTRATPWPFKLGWSHDPARRVTSSAFEFGYQDLDGFCKAVESVFPVKRVLRGHDHVENGFEITASYKNTPLMTLNGFGFGYTTNSVAKYRQKLVLGVGITGQLPRIEEVDYLPEEHAGVYPPKQPENSTS